MYLSFIIKKGNDKIQADAIPAYKKTLKKNDLKNIIYQMISEIFCLFLIVLTFPFLTIISEANGFVL